MLKNLKTVIVVLLASVLLFNMFACSKDAEDYVDTSSNSEPSVNAPTPAPDTDSESDGGENKGDIQITTTYLNANTSGIKLLGVRGISSETQINCDHSGSGIEFTLRNTGRSLAFEVTSSAACRFKVFIDGEVCKSVSGENFFEVNGTGIITIGSVPLGNHTVSLVKITDGAYATAQLTRVIYSGIISEDTPQNKKTYIEFIGGSDAVGTGLVAGNGYSSQDVTEAYTYKLAKMMDTDYSVFSVASPVTGEQELSALYTKASFIRDTDNEYDFSRKADVAIIDLGALDESLADVDCEVFAEKYKDLINTVRAKNGDTCKIVCIYRSSFDKIATAIQTVYRDALGGQENGYYLCKMADGEDGTLNAAEIADFLPVLQSTVDSAIKGVITEKEMEAEENGGSLVVDFNTFVPVKNKQTT